RSSDLGVGRVDTGRRRVQEGLEGLGRTGVVTGLEGIERGLVSGALVGTQGQRARIAMDPRGITAGGGRRGRGSRCGGRGGAGGGGRRCGQFPAFQAVEAAVQVQVLVAAALLHLLLFVLQLFQRRAQFLHLAAQLRQLVEQVL